MTDRETVRILNFLRGCYPAFYRRATPDEADNTLMAWSVLFSESYYTYDLVIAAVKRYVTGQCGKQDSDYNRFPPSPGEIVQELSKNELRDMKFVLLAEELHRETLYNEAEVYLLDTVTDSKVCSP